MQIALLVALKDLRQRARDRSVFIMGFLAPFGLAFIISSALSGVDNSFHATYALVDNDHGALAQAFAGVLHSPPLDKLVDVRIVQSRDEAAALTRKTVDAAFVIPAGFSASALSGGSARIEVLRNRANLIGGTIAADIARGFTARIDGTSLAVRTALATGTPQGKAGDVVAAALSAPMAVTLGDGSAGGRAQKPAAFFGPAMAMFFLFFTVGIGARSLMGERTQGTLARLRAAPIPSWTVLAGKGIASFVVGVLSMVTLVVASAVLLGAQWGQPAALVALIVATVLAVMGITALLMVLAKTQEAATAYSSAVAVVLALLGGNFLPNGQGPALLRRLTLVTPNGWALRAFADLAAGGPNGLSVVLPSIAVLVGFAAVTTGLALTRANRMVAV